MIRFYKYMVDKYEVLSDLSRTPEEKRFRLDQLFYYQQLLKQFNN